MGTAAVGAAGPVVAAGWLASTAAVAAAGGVAGGILGALTEAGLSEEDAHVYAEGVRRGGTLLTVRVSEVDRARIEAKSHLGDQKCLSPWTLVHAVAHTSRSGCIDQGFFVAVSSRSPNRLAA